MLSKMKMDVIHATRANSYSPYKGHTTHILRDPLQDSDDERGPFRDDLPK